jgi:hypothetical protein
MSFKRLDPQDFLISADSVVGGAWSDGTVTLTNKFTSSTQTEGETGKFYTEIFRSLADITTGLSQFSIGYGDSVGSGSTLYDSNIEGKSPSATVFGQFQNIVLGDENTNFTFGGVTPQSQSIFALAINRARYKGNLFPGTLDLRLSGSGLGANGELQLTDNSKDISTVSFNEAGRVFQLVSGSNGSAIASTATNGVAPGMTASGSYGLFLPDIGTIILNHSALSLPVANGGVALPKGGQGAAGNLRINQRLHERISASIFTLNSQENITSDFVFVRARNGEYNYSENPSFISGSTGEVLINNFINAPQTFITSIGLYNDNNELLAVAKLSKPLKKDFTKEALVRVKLDF